MEILKFKNYVKIKDKFNTDIAVSRLFAKEVVDSVDINKPVVIDMEGIKMITRSFIDEIVALTNNNVKFINVASYLKCFFDFEEKIIGKKIKVEYI